MKKEIRLTVSKKFDGISIESFLTSEEIGASLSLSDLKTALFADIEAPLVKAISDFMGSPGFLMTKKGFADSLGLAVNAILKDEISESLDRIIHEMKQSTKSVAALKQSAD